MASCMAGLLGTEGAGGTGPTERLCRLLYLISGRKLGISISVLLLILPTIKETVFVLGFIDIILVNVGFTVVK